MDKHINIRLNINKNLYSKYHDVVYIAVEEYIQNICKYLANKYQEEVERVFLKINLESEISIIPYYLVNTQLWRKTLLMITVCKLIFCNTKKKRKQKNNNTKKTKKTKTQTVCFIISF